MLPWFGTITARENYANAMAEAEFKELAVMRRQLALEVSKGVYELYANKEQQKVLEENTVLLETYEKQALTMVEVGKASVVDVLRIQIRQNELQERIQVLEQQYQARETTLNSLLNRDAHTEIIISETLEIPREEAVPAEDSLSMHPELLKYGRLCESVKQAEVLNQKESAPNLGVGVDYVPVQERAGMTFSDNRKDILMPMVSLTVPIFNRTYSSRTRQNTLRSRLESAVAARNVARIRYETLSENLDRARSAEQILIRNYETGTIDFNDVLDIQELQRNFRMKRIEAVRPYYSQAAMINYISGV